MLYVHCLHFASRSFKMCYLLSQTTTAIQRLVDEYDNNNDVNHAQCKILAILKHHNRPLTHAEICSYLYRESQTVGASLTRLLDKGYVKKKVDPKDKRYVRIEITAKGEQVIEKQFQWMMPLCNEIMSCFSDDEVEQIESHLVKLLDWVFQLSGIEVREPLDEFFSIPAEL